MYSWFYGKQAVIRVFPPCGRLNRHAVVVYPGLRRLFFRGVATVGLKPADFGNPGGVAPFVEGLRIFRHDNGIFRGNRQAGETERRRFAEVTACWRPHRQRVFLFQQKWNAAAGTGDRAGL